MQQYVILLRGINVGGKNKVPMAQLKTYLEELGFTNVSTYIASGNVILQSPKAPHEIEEHIEKTLPHAFKLDSSIIKIRALTHNELKAIVHNKPAGFGEDTDTYLYDAIFLIGMSASEVLAVFRPRDGVDAIWPGDGVIYSRRLSALRVKSRSSAIVGTKEYQHMTIRNWNTVIALLERMNTTN